MTSAMPWRGALLGAGPDDVLATCAMRSARPCSPSAQRSASARLLLPEPFGPTTALMPGPNSTMRPLGERLEALERGAPGGAPGRVTDAVAASASASTQPRSRGRPSAAGDRRRGDARSQRLERLGGGRRLGDPARRALADAERPPVDRDLDPERASRGPGPVASTSAVVRPLAGRPLGVLLEPALGALERRRSARPPASSGAASARSQSRAAVAAEIEVERADERLERRREQRRPAPAAALGLALAEQQVRRRGRSGAASRASPAVDTIAARRADRTPSSSLGMAAVQRLGDRPG